MEVGGGISRGFPAPLSNLLPRPSAQGKGTAESVWEGALPKEAQVEGERRPLAAGLSAQVEGMEEESLLCPPAGATLTSRG